MPGCNNSCASVSASICKWVCVDYTWQLLLRFKQAATIGACWLPYCYLGTIAVITTSTANLCTFFCAGVWHVPLNWSALSCLVCPSQHTVIFLTMRITLCTFATIELMHWLNWCSLRNLLNSCPVDPTFIKLHRPTMIKTHTLVFFNYDSGNQHLMSSCLFRYLVEIILIYLCDHCQW